MTEPTNWREPSPDGTIPYRERVDISGDRLEIINNYDDDKFEISLSKDGDVRFETEEPLRYGPSHGDFCSFKVSKEIARQIAEHILRIATE